MIEMYLIMGFTTIFVGVIVGLTPRFTRKNIHFGVTLPEVAQDMIETKRWKQNYFRSSLTFTALGLVIMSLILFLNLDEQSAIEYLGIVGSIVVSVLSVIQFVLYFVYHNRAKAFKQANFDLVSYQNNQRIQVATDFHENMKHRFPWVVVLSLLLVGLTVFLTFNNYDNLPEYLIQSWNGPNNVTYRPRTFSSLMLLPFIQMVLIISFTLAMFVMKKTRQLINPRYGKKSVATNIRFRKATIDFLGLMCAATVALLFGIQLGITQIIPMERTVIWFTLLYLAFILLGVVFLMLKFGQGGSRLNEHDEADNQLEMYDDDAHWLWGMIYFNPNDPALFVEQKFGIGSTVNMARWQAWAFIGVIVLIVAVSLIVTFIYA